MTDKETDLKAHNDAKRTLENSGTLTKSSVSVVEVVRPNVFYLPGLNFT